MTIENFGRTPADGQNCRAYTLGPCRWFRHQSPMLGRITGVKDPKSEDQQQASADGEKKSPQQYNFQANQIQLQGPVPPQLYHRFVEFKPWVARMFTAGGLQGLVLSKALHHQHSRVYNFGRSTVCGHFPRGPGEGMTQQFLDLVHYDKGGRIFTYIISLDALWRFTETGKEFGVDMLSKHTMHSDVSTYIAFSGEFFIRRLKHLHRPAPRQPLEDVNQEYIPHEHDTQTPYEIDDDAHHVDDVPPTDPSRYELVIDNDSGTYRPNADMLPLLKSYLSHCLPGLNIRTLDCQADADKMGKMKARQRERKKAEGDGIVYAQGDDSSSMSSSDDERLDAAQEAFAQETDADRRAREEAATKEDGTTRMAARDWKRKQGARIQKGKRVVLNSSRDNEPGPTVGYPGT